MLPRTVTCPLEGYITPAITLSMVLLPLPFLPMRATASPGWMLNETFFSAKNSSKCSWPRISFRQYSLMVSVFSLARLNRMVTLFTSTIGVAIFSLLTNTG